MDYKPNSALDQQTPLLAEEDLLTYVEYCFNLSEKYADLLKNNRPPMYLFDTSVLLERAEQFKKAFRDVFAGAAFYYPVKSNNHPDVAKTLLTSGFGLDVSSGLELEMALELGTDDIIFSGPGKTAEELYLAVMNSDRVSVLIDSFGELARLQEIASAEDRLIRAGVRLAMSAKPLWRKFGIAPEELRLFWEDAQKSSHINFCGIQFHISWNRTPAAHCESIAVISRTLSKLPDRCRRELEFLDIGGGYWPPRGEWLQPAGTREGKVLISRGEEAGPATVHYCLPSAPIEHFAEEIGRAVREHIEPLLRARICLEPGRWICNDSMHLIMTVVDRKSDDLVITDAGTNAIGWERFETDYCPVLNLTRPALQENVCSIMGSLCTPHDIWGYTYWGEDIREGDVLMIPDQGAYTFSLRQQFIKQLPPVVTI